MDNNEKIYDSIMINGGIQKENGDNFSQYEIDKIYDEFIDFIESKKLGYGGSFEGYRDK